MNEIQKVGKDQFEDIFNSLRLRNPEEHASELVGIYLSSTHKYLEFKDKDGNHSFIEYEVEA